MQQRFAMPLTYVKSRTPISAGRFKQSFLVLPVKTSCFITRVRMDGAIAGGGTFFGLPILPPVLQIIACTGPIVFIGCLLTSFLGTF